jgi:hypothetical protein
MNGRLGGVKVLVMENRDRKSDDDPSHTLFVAEAPDRRQGAQQVAQERSGGEKHPRPARGTHSLCAAPSRGIRRRSMPTSMMRRSGRGEGGWGAEALPPS